MNGSHGGLEQEARLKGFYAYKNTFGTDSVWLDIPKQGPNKARWRSTHTEPI